MKERIKKEPTEIKTPQEAYNYRVTNGIPVEHMAFLMDMSTSAYQRWEYQRKSSESKSAD